MDNLTRIIFGKLDVRINTKSSSAEESRRKLEVHFHVKQKPSIKRTFRKTKFSIIEKVKILGKACVVARYVRAGKNDRSARAHVCAAAARFAGGADQKAVLCLCVCVLQIGGEALSAFETETACSVRV